MKTYLLTAAATLGLLAMQSVSATPDNSAVINPATTTTTVVTTVPADAPIRMAPYEVSGGRPVLTQVVEPMVQSQFSGQQLEMKFTVDKHGHAYNIDATNLGVDRNLVVQLTNAIQAWQFEPARDSSGHAIDRAVILPVSIRS